MAIYKVELPLGVGDFDSDYHKDYYFESDNKPTKQHILEGILESESKDEYYSKAVIESLESLEKVDESEFSKKGREDITTVEFTLPNYPYDVFQLKVYRIKLIKL